MNLLNIFTNFKYLIGLFSLLIGFVNCAENIEYIKEKPSYIQSCKIFQPGFTKCSTESVQKLFQEIGKGIPEVDKYIGKFDPLKLEQLHFKQDNNEAASIKATLTNLVATGLKNVQIKESRVSKKDFSWLTKVFIPKFRLEGDYKMDGRILLLPLNGEGKMFIEITDMDVLMRTKTKLIEQGGFTFYNVTQVQAEINISKLKTKFDNLFGGNNKEIEDSTNESFNKNWKEFFEALRPLITDTVEKIMFKVLHNVFLVYPANFLVEDIPKPKDLYGKE